MCFAVPRKRITSKKPECRSAWRSWTQSIGAAHCSTGTSGGRQARPQAQAFPCPDGRPVSRVVPSDTETVPVPNSRAYLSGAAVAGEWAGGHNPAHSSHTLGAETTETSRSTVLEPEGQVQGLGRAGSFRSSRGESFPRFLQLPEAPASLAGSPFL